MSSKGRADEFRESVKHTLYRYATYLWISLLFIVGVLLIYAVESLTQLEGFWAHLVRDLGIAAITASFLGAAYEYGLRRAFVEDTKDALSKIYEAHHEQLEEFDAAGLVGLHSSLSRELLRNKFEQAAKANKASNVPKAIRILQTYTGQPDNDRGLRDLLGWAAKENSDIRILVLHPLSAQVQYRAESLEREVTDVRNHVKQDLIYLNKHFPDRVRVYDANPMFHIYGFDDIYLIGAYWRKGQLSIDGPQLEIDRTKATRENLAGLICNHFESLWELSQSQQGTDASTAIADLEKEEAREREGEGSTSTAADMRLTLHPRLHFDVLKQRFLYLTDRAKIEQHTPEIRILQTALGHRDEGDEDISLFGMIKNAAKAGCKLKIMLLNPESHHVESRTNALRESTEYRPRAERIREDIEGDLKALHDVASDLEKEGKGGNLEVRVYDAAPAIQFYDFDRRRIVGLSWTRLPSRNGPQLEIDDSDNGDRSTSLAERIDKQFEDLWDSSATVDASEVIEKGESTKARKRRPVI